MSVIPIMPGFQGVGTKAINANNEIVGTAYGAPGGTEPSHAFIYRDGQFTDIGGLFAPGTSSSASAINNLGHIVGEYPNSNGSGTFLYNGSPQLYPQKSIYQNELVSINDADQIVGYETLAGNSGPPSSYIRYPNGTVVGIPNFQNNPVRPIAINNVGQILVQCGQNEVVSAQSWRRQWRQYRYTGSCSRWQRPQCVGASGRSVTASCSIAGLYDRTTK